jgi:hypothetical protein
MLRRPLLLLLPVLAAPFACGQTTAEAPSTKAADRPFYARIPGMFDLDLPEIDPPGTVKLIMHPHFSDLYRRDYLRVDAGFRWAVNERFEFTPEGRVYLTHGLGDTNDGYGIGEVRFGAKYILPRWPDYDMETSLTLAAYAPIQGAPEDLTDGLNHLTPGFVIQHHSVRRSKWTTFGGAGFDIVDPSDVIGTPIENQPRDDSVYFTAGAIYDLGQLKYTLTATYATTAGFGEETDHFFYLRPNIFWYVPKRFVFNTKTQWALVLGARISFGPDGSLIDFRSRVRAEITFRQVMDKLMPPKITPADVTPP